MSLDSGTLSYNIIFTLWVSALVGKPKIYSALAQVRYLTINIRQKVVNFC